MSGPYITRIAQILGHEARIEQQCTIVLVRVLRLIYSCCVIMGIDARFEHLNGPNTYNMVTQNGAQPWLPVALVQPPPFQAHEVHVELVHEEQAGEQQGADEQEMTDKDQPLHGLHYHTGLYQAIRLPP